MRLTHLTLRNWRNFKQADFDMQDRMFVIGPNASGKSNLLDALRFLRQVASPGGGFQNAVMTRGGMSRVRCLAARNFNHGHATVGVSIGDDERPTRWLYQITFTAESRGRHRPILRSETVERDGETVLRRPTTEDTDDPERMTQTHLEQVNANRDFREIVDYLGSIRYLHLVPQLIREPDRGGDRSDDPYGADFLLRMAKTRAPTRTRRLHRISQSLKAAVPQLDQLDLVQDEIGHWHLQARYEHWRPQPARQNEQDLSDGTLRLIGLLWSAPKAWRDAGPVLLEEPELSLHCVGGTAASDDPPPDHAVTAVRSVSAGRTLRTSCRTQGRCCWKKAGAVPALVGPGTVRQLPTILHRIRSAGGPQVLLTTHATDILQDPGLGKDEVVLLTPEAEGTVAEAASSIPDIQALLDAGNSLADILAPENRAAGGARSPQPSHVRMTVDAPAGSPRSRAPRGAPKGRHGVHPVSNALSQVSAAWSQVGSGRPSVFETRCHSGGMLRVW